MRSVPAGSSTAPCLATALLLAALAAPRADAQEFTRQTLLVAPFHSVGPVRVARQAAATVRSRLARTASRRELWVPGGDTLETLLVNSGFRRDTILDELGTFLLARSMRADEVVTATVESRAGSVEIRAQMRIPRDWRLRQPLPVVRAANAAAAADSLTKQILNARTQMVGLRRCENAARIADFDGAVRAAELAVRSYGSSTLARTCLALALRFHGAGADSVGRVTDDILVLDSLNIVAAVLRASVLLSLDRPALAALAWARVVDLRPDSLDLGLTAVEHILRLQKPGLALEESRRLAATHRGEPRVRRLMFRAQVALGQWADAAALGDSLEAVDAEFRDDSSYSYRHVEALRLTGDTLSALARSARAVRQHRGDVDLYLQYVKLITSEHAIALPRGLALFPESPELHVLAARASLAGGKRRDAIVSLNTAVVRDTTLVQGFLQIAELWFEEGEPDSALAAIARVPRGGSADLLRAYAMSRGRQMVRAASDTTPATWRRAAGLFALADSLDSQDDTRSLIAASTLELARTELVAAINGRTCPETMRASNALQTAGDALDRGVGNGSSATELRTAYDALRASIENALKVLCDTKRSDRRP
jgi:predicted Zn-dependent protease